MDEDDRETDEDCDMDDVDAELTGRRGKFLEVVETSTGYRERSAKGELVEFVPMPHPIEVSIENLVLHMTSDTASGAVTSMLTGSTSQEFRAIGTEGSYQILDVAISSSTPPGTAVIKDVYAKDGHPLRSEMSLGLPDDTINKFVEQLPGTLRIGGFDSRFFYTSGGYERALLLDYWRRHVIADTGSEDVTIEWPLTFSTVTLSPVGYSKLFGFGMSTPSNDKNERHLSGSVGVELKVGTGHPLVKSIEGLTSTIAATQKSIFNALAVVVVLLIYLAFFVHR